MSVSINKAVRTAPYMPSIYGNTPEKHFYDLPDAVSVTVSDIFPAITPAIYKFGDDLKIIADATRESLKNVDMSKIQQEDTINLCCSEHGFTLLGGNAYVTMIKTIKEVVEERTNNQNIRLRLCMYRTPAEAKEVIEYYHLREQFDCEIMGCGPFDEGVEIDTYIGKLYGLKKVYDADWFIYAYYDDPREMYVHRSYNRCLKSFMMNFARYEVRSCVHNTYGPSSAMIIPQAIFDSEFVQNKFAFGTFLMTAPTGVVEIRSDTDLYAIDRASQINMLKNYEMMRELFSQLDPYIAVWDGGRWGYYLHTGGLVFGSAEISHYPFFDLDVPYTMDRSKMMGGYDGGVMAKGVGDSPILKGIVSNQSWIGLNVSFVAHGTPTWCVGEEQLNMYRHDPTNQGFMPGMAWADLVTLTDTLEHGIAEAQEKTGVKNVIAFDGNFGAINCNREAAEDIIKKAAPIHDHVMKEVYPKLLRQRGIDPTEVLGE